MLSGVKINFNKSVVCGIGVGDDPVNVFAGVLNCKTQVLPIKYLGLPLGAIPRLAFGNLYLIISEESWHHGSVVLSLLGGRLTLIKSVLSNLPIYFMSLFKLPEKVAKSIESIQSNFSRGVGVGVGVGVDGGW